MKTDTLPQFGACRFDPVPGLLGEVFKSPNYHTRIPDGRWVHVVLRNFDYAAALLRDGEPDAVARAHAILGMLLRLQDRDPVNATFGIWPWVWEEPLKEMSPPDWNWADFCGARLANMLADLAGRLEPALAAEMRLALRAAAGAIFRRNVQPDYTNIAIMGAGVCAAAGELLGEDWLLAYGRRRLAACVAQTEHHGGFAEFNSPTYTVIAVEECERILHLVSDPETRAHAEALRKHAWTVIAEHFHPATGQWAGPHVRAYSDRLAPATMSFLAARAPVVFHAEAVGAQARTGAPGAAGMALPCPEALTSAFRDPVRAPVTRTHRFLRHADGLLERAGTTWMAPEACLGSMNFGDFWTQCRPLLGYWKTAGGAVAVLRLRLLHNGRDFASGLITNAQDGPRVLSAIHFATNRGSWHPSLNRPADGVFPTTDLRLRYELTGGDAFGTQLSEGVFLLQSGDWRVRISTAPSKFGPHPVVWKLTTGSGVCCLEAVCHEGPEFPFRPRDVSPVRLGAGLELLEPGAPDSAVSPPPGWKADGPEAFILRWASLSVRAPAGADDSWRGQPGCDRRE